MKSLFWLNKDEKEVQKQLSKNLSFESILLLNDEMKEMKDVLEILTKGNNKPNEKEEN